LFINLGKTDYIACRVARQATLEYHS
jgi:hypothetical protein